MNEKYPIQGELTPFEDIYDRFFGKITDDMYLTTSADIVETFGSADAPEKYLVALGCASWTAGQLEQEIADNAWLVAPASDTILFETIYEDRYPAANQLLGINPHNFVFSQVGHS